ncbi:MAG: DUF3307 domain-containing protein, partial [Chloroflexaceae bacterium]|nr:DUF3307 domain-containing protein [Chloroflexaceae bacterium]
MQAPDGSSASDRTVLGKGFDPKHRTTTLQKILQKDKLMHLLITLLLAHLFADFPLQTNRLARLKRTSLKGVLIHVLIYMVVTAFSVAISHLHFWTTGSSVSVAVHFVI